MSIYQGTYFSKTFAFKYPKGHALAGQAVDITDWTFAAQLRDRVDTDVLLELTTADGNFEVTDGEGGLLLMKILAADTTDLPLVKLVFDVLRTDQSPGPIWLFRGKLPVKQSATVVE